MSEIRLPETVVEQGDDSQVIEFGEGDHQASFFGGFARPENLPAGDSEAAPGVKLATQQAQPG